MLTNAENRHTHRHRSLPYYFIFFFQSNWCKCVKYVDLSKLINCIKVPSTTQTQAQRPYNCILREKRTGRAWLGGRSTKKHLRKRANKQKKVNINVKRLQQCRQAERAWNNTKTQHKQYYPKNWTSSLPRRLVPRRRSTEASKTCVVLDKLFLNKTNKNTFFFLPNH